MQVVHFLRTATVALAIGTEACSIYSYYYTFSNFCCTEFLLWDL